MVIKKCNLSMDITGRFRIGDVHTFTAFSHGIPPILYSWGIDGIVIAGPQATHAFENPGLYFITPTAENDCSEPLKFGNL